MHNRSMMAGVAIMTALSLPVSAQTLAEFYKGKTVSIVVSTGEGGTYDTVARSVARYMPKHIPGEPSMILRYMPGAGHVVATNY